MKVSEEDGKKVIVSRYTRFASGFPFWPRDLRVEPLPDAHVGSRCLDKTAVPHNLYPLALDLCRPLHGRSGFLERKEGKP